MLEAPKGGRVKKGAKRSAVSAKRGGRKRARKCTRGLEARIWGEAWGAEREGGGGHSLRSCGGDLHICKEWSRGVPQKWRSAYMQRVE